MIDRCRCFTARSDWARARSMTSTRGYRCMITSAGMTVVIFRVVAFWRLAVGSCVSVIRRVQARVRLARDSSGYHSAAS